MERNKNESNFRYGTLPGASAPLAIAYVPMQTSATPAYEAAEALSRGTLFPGLDLPFMNMVNKGNYTGTAATTWKITAIDPVLANFDVTPTLPAAQAYDGAHKTVTVVPKSGVNGMGTVKVYYEATTGITYPKSETAPTDVGTYKVTASVAAGSNYNAKDIDVGTLTINQATGGTLAAYNFQQKYTDLTAKTITPD